MSEIERKKKLRQKNLALLAVLIGVISIFFMIGVVRIQQVAG